MQITQVKIEELIPYARNARTHSIAQIAEIAASIKEFGFNNPVLLRDDNTIIAGHGRVQAALKLSMSEVPCVYLSHLTENQARAYVLADNQLATHAGWEIEMLRLELDDLSALGFDPELLGFGEHDLAELIPPAEKNIDEDEVPEPPVEPITKPGDLWLLGEHRLLCGDSTKAEDVERLMAGAKADLCFTSPPYALGKSVALSGNKSMSAKGKAYDQHQDDAESWATLMNGWWEQSLSVVSTAWLVNVQPLAGNKRDLMRWIADRVDRLIDIITWDKGHSAPQMEPGVLASRYEWIIAIGKQNASRAFPMSTWRGTMQSVYQAPPQRANEHSEIHAATMPIHVPVWAIGSLCDQSKSVYEPFCGTGTTLIAAEQLGRKCYGMEISPQYCDVVVKRWETLTGNKAELCNG